MAVKDPDAHRASSRRYYERNKATVLAKRAKYREENREAINVAKTETRRQLSKLARETKDRPCADCNVPYPFYVMEFDHVRGEKFATIAQLIGYGCSRKELEAEIEKCDVVCSNCHRERTHGH